MRPRWTEAGLLMGPLLLGPLGLAWLGAARDGRIEPARLWPALLASGLLVLAHLWLCLRLPSADQVVLPLVGGLVAIGLVIVNRLDAALGPRQAAWIAVGTLALAGAAAWEPAVGRLKRYRYTLAVAGLAGVLVTLVFGIDPNGSGARLWLGLGGLYFQPSEALKILLVVFLAAYLDDYRELLAFGGPRLGPWRLPPLPYLLPLLAMLGLSQVLLVAQHDLGAALLFYGLFMTMLYLASGRLVYLLLGGLLFVLTAGLAYLAFDHVRVRVSTWLDPWSQAASAGYQLVQALLALGSGGLLGSGLAAGAPGYIPAVATDYVIAAIGEELGLLGTLAVVALYALLIGRGLRIALARPEGFEMLLAAGLVAIVGLQALVILAGTLRLAPLTGVTLPFVSYGGSSILANFLIVGLLLRLSASPEVPADAS